MDGNQARLPDSTVDYVSGSARSRFNGAESRQRFGLQARHTDYSIFHMIPVSPEERREEKRGMDGLLPTRVIGGTTAKLGDRKVQRVFSEVWVMQSKWHDKASEGFWPDLWQLAVERLGRRQRDQGLPRDITSRFTR